MTDHLIPTFPSTVPPRHPINTNTRRRPPPHTIRRRVDANRRHGENIPHLRDTQVPRLPCGAEVLQPAVRRLGVEIWTE